MTPLFQKLNAKDHKELFIIHAPQAFAMEISAIEQNTTVHKTIRAANDPITFILTFVLTLEQIQETMMQVHPRLEGDATIWFAYPKKTSKKYSSSISRDSGWDTLGKYSIEPVRQIAIDQDWTALRFRKVEFIKKLTRNDSMFLSEKGKQKKALDSLN